MPKNIQQLFKPDNRYKVTGSLWMECENERFFGPGRVELLEHINETGSINKAAKKMGMSYKKAWEMVNQLNKQTVAPMVISQSGGEQGGGSSITNDAKELITFYKELRIRFNQFLAEETNQLKKDIKKIPIKTN